MGADPWPLDMGRSGAPRRLALFQVGQEQRQRRRRHAVEPRRLTEGRGPVPLELLAQLVGEAGQGGEIELGRDGNRLVLAEGGDVRLLTRRGRPA